MWSGLGVDKLLHLLIALINSALEKEDHFAFRYNRISSKRHKFISLS